MRAKSIEPVISVLIPVRDGGDSLRNTLECLRKQHTDGIPWELVIVDDGSDVPVEKQYKIDLPENTCLKIIRIEGSGSRSAARNRAWLSAGSKTVLWLDSDLDFGSDLILKHLELHKADAGDVIMGNRIDSWSINSTHFQRWFDTRGMRLKPAGEFPWKYFVTGNLSMKKELLEKTGGFDESIVKWGGEDTELGYRLDRLGIKFYWEPSIQVRHVHRISVRTYASRMVEYGNTGLRYILEKHPDLDNLLGSRWIKPVFAAPCRLPDLIMRILVRVVTIPIVYRMVLKWVETVGRPAFMFTFVSIGGCLMGLRDKRHSRLSD